MELGAGEILSLDLDGPCVGLAWLQREKHEASGEGHAQVGATIPPARLSCLHLPGDFDALHPGWIRDFQHAASAVCQAERDGDWFPNPLRRNVDQGYDGLGGRLRTRDGPAGSEDMNLPSAGIGLGEVGQDDDGAHHAPSRCREARISADVAVKAASASFLIGSHSPSVTKSFTTPMMPVGSSLAAPAPVLWGGGLEGKRAFLGIILPHRQRKAGDELRDSAPRLHYLSEWALTPEYREFDGIMVPAAEPTSAARRHPALDTIYANGGRCIAHPARKARRWNTSST